MKTVTYEEFLKFKPCWLEEPEKTRKLEEISGRKERWTALDVLNLPEEEVSDEDKIWAVVRPEFMEEMDLHEFACWCAEDALSRVKDPDPRSVAAVEAKRKWMRGEIGDEELNEARKAAWVAESAAWAAESDAKSAAWAAASAAAWSGKSERIVRLRQAAKLRELLSHD